ncbi:transposase ISCc1, partial [Sinorhizobium fredii USDA 205]
ERLGYRPATPLVGTRPAATLKASHPDRCLGRSHGGLTTKIHALTDGLGLPVRIVITPGHAHDLTAVSEMLDGIGNGETLLADKAYDADWLRKIIRTRGAWANIPPRSNRKGSIVFSPWLYKKRNLIERFFNKLKCSRRIATRYEKLGSTFLAMTKLACIRVVLRHYESATYSAIVPLATTSRSIATIPIRVA